MEQPSDRDLPGTRRDQGNITTIRISKGERNCIAVYFVTQVFCTTGVGSIPDLQLSRSSPTHTAVQAVIGSEGTQFALLLAHE